jgi:hypothetical protein
MIPISFVSEGAPFCVTKGTAFVVVSYLNLLPGKVTCIQNKLLNCLMFFCLKNKRDHTLWVRKKMIYKGSSGIVEGPSYFEFNPQYCKKKARKSF